MKTHKLYFQDASYHDGINTTIRRGKHWYSRIKTGDQIIICQTKSKLKDHPIANVVGVAYLPFEEIPLHWIEWHHCYSGYTEIIDAMKKTYPGFKIEDLVTVILFEVE